MKLRDLLVTLALLLFLAPFVTGQTMPVGGMGSVSGGVGRFADGSSSAPGIAFSAATNTGIFRVGGSTCFTTSGTQGPCVNGATFGATGAGNLNIVQMGLNNGAVSWNALGSTSASVSAVNGSDGAGPASIHAEGVTRTLAVPAGAYGFATASTTSVGNTGQGARLVVVCGPTAGTASLLFYAGTTNTPVVLANAVGGGLIGC